MPIKTPEAEQPASFRFPESFEIKLDEVSNSYEFHDGFSRPNWGHIQDAILRAENDLSPWERWEEVILQWLRRLQLELGGNYNLSRNKHFICLSTLKARDAGSFLAFAENAHVEISQRLGDLAWKDTPGPHVVLLFEEADDYFEYVIFFSLGRSWPIPWECNWIMAIRTWPYDLLADARTP